MIGKQIASAYSISKSADVTPAVVDHFIDQNEKVCLHDFMRACYYTSVHAEVMRPTMDDVRAAHRGLIQALSEAN